MEIIKFMDFLEQYVRKTRKYDNKLCHIYGNGSNKRYFVPRRIGFDEI
jgi:hypothetical protein